MNRGVIVIEATDMLGSSADYVPFREDANFNITGTASDGCSVVCSSPKRDMCAYSTRLVGWWTVERKRSVAPLVGDTAARVYI